MCVCIILGLNKISHRKLHSMLQASEILDFIKANFHQQQTFGSIGGMHWHFNIQQVKRKLTSLSSYPALHLNPQDLNTKDLLWNLSQNIMCSPPIRPTRKHPQSYLLIGIITYFTTTAIKFKIHGLIPINCNASLVQIIFKLME